VAQNDWARRQDDRRGSASTPRFNLLRRAVLHNTPERAGWVNMAKIEIGVLD
jgi:hypothetical protein